MYLRNTMSRRPNYFAQQAKMQISWVLSEKERDRRYNKLKKVGFRNEFHPRTNSETSSSTVSDFANAGFRTEFYPRTNFESLSNAVATLPKAVSLGITPDIQFTLEEHLHLESLRNYMKNVARAYYERFFFYEKACLNHMAKVSYFGGTMDYQHWNRFVEASDNFAQDMFFNLDIMKEFRPNDQVEI
jgi:hypothetical protein